MEVVLEPEDLAFWDAGTHRWRVEPGLFEVQIGASSSDIRLMAQFEVIGQ